MITSDDPPFATIAIVGLGLIGGSIALGIRQRWPSIRVVGHDRDAVLAHAVGSGAIDRAAASLSALGDVDLLVLAAPVRKNVELLGQLPAQGSTIGLVTDVGSTKRDIVAAGTRPSGVPFIGGHPLGGAERGGFGFASPDLFKGRPWIFTPATDDRTPSLERLFHLARGLGARPSTMTPEAHDRLMAFVSHLPQLAASALMETVGRAAGDGLPLAGRGLADTTRLASSPASVWRDVCATNSDVIGDALDLFIARLQELRADLTSGDVLERVFEDAARWRGELTKTREP